MTKEDKIYGLIGLAARARKIAYGYDAVVELIKMNKAKLVIVTTDASDKTKKNMQYTCNKYNVELIIFGNKDKISHIIGKENKVIVALKDKNISGEICKRFYGGDAIE